MSRTIEEQRERVDAVGQSYADGSATYAALSAERDELARLERVAADADAREAAHRAVQTKQRAEAQRVADEQSALAAAAARVRAQAPDRKRIEELRASLQPALVIDEKRKLLSAALVVHRVTLAVRECFARRTEAEAEIAGLAARLGEPLLPSDKTEIGYYPARPAGDLARTLISMFESAGNESITRAHVRASLSAWPANRIAELITLLAEAGALSASRGPTREESAALAAARAEVDLATQAELSARDASTRANQELAQRGKGFWNAAQDARRTLQHASTRLHNAREVERMLVASLSEEGVDPASCGPSIVSRVGAALAGVFA